MAEIQREAGFLGDDESKSSGKLDSMRKTPNFHLPQDETFQTITLERVNKSISKKLSSEGRTLADTDLCDYSLGRPKNAFSSSSIDRTAILDFPCSLSSFPASFLLETYKSKSVSEVPLSGLVSAFPSSQALGITVSCSMQKLVQSDLPSEKSLVRTLHNSFASALPNADTFTSICERPSAPVPPPSFNGLRITRSSAALNILRKAKSNLKLLSFRSLRNLAKLKTESESNDNKVPNLSSSTNPRVANESLVQNLPPIASVVSKSPHFFSWFPFPEIDSPLRQFESPLSITPSPSSDSYIEIGSSNQAETDPKSSTGSDTPKQTVLASLSANTLQGSTLGTGGSEYTGVIPRSESIKVDHSGTNRGFLSPPSTTLHPRQNAQTLRGYRRERVAEIHSFQRLKDDLDVINTFLENSAEVMVDKSSGGCHPDTSTLISGSSKSKEDIVIPQLLVSNINDSESVADINIMTTLVKSPDGSEDLDKPKIQEEIYKKKQGIWSKLGLGSQKAKLCDNFVSAVPLPSHFSVSMTASPSLNGVNAKSGERSTKALTPKLKRDIPAGSRLGSNGCLAPARHPLHIFTSARNKVMKTTRMLSTKGP